MSTGWIVLGVIVIIVLFAFGAYNRLVALSQRVSPPAIWGMALVGSEAG